MNDDDLQIYEDPKAEPWELRAVIDNLNKKLAAYEEALDNSEAALAGRRAELCRLSAELSTERDRASAFEDQLKQATRELEAERDVLQRHGFVRCDIAACNCGSWHARYGMPERMVEICNELHDADVLDNSTGNLPLNAIKKLRYQLAAGRGKVASLERQLDEMQDGVVSKALADMYVNQIKERDAALAAERYRASAFEDQLKQATRELEAEREKVLRTVRGEFSQICSSCGWEAPASGASWDELQAHIQVCPMHPITAERDRASAFEDQLKQATRELEAEREITAKMTREKYPFVHLRFDASEPEKEGAIRAKMVELGWATPEMLAAERARSSKLQAQVDVAREALEAASSMLDRAVEFIGSDTMRGEVRCAEIAASRMSRSLAALQPAATQAVCLHTGPCSASACQWPNCKPAASEPANTIKGETK